MSEKQVDSKQGMSVVLNGGTKEIDSATVPIKWFFSDDVLAQNPIKKDAWNWWHGINNSSHGVDWSTRVDKDIVTKIKGLDFEKSLDILIPYLEKNNKNYDFDNIIKETKINFGDQFQSACMLMEKVTKHPLYRDSFTLFLTTFPRSPYSYEKGYIWLCVLWSGKCYLGILLHELLHFQTFAYYYDTPEFKKLTPTKKEFLKESLTVVLNYEFKEYMCQPDKGYDIHQNLRKRLKEYYLENRDFEKLVKYGCKIV